MNVRALQCFLKVYERRSINAAAKEVYLSPQGLSKVIKQLELDLEAELFSRGTAGMEATEAGELLYARARHVCYLMDDIKKEIGIINGSKGSLTVVATYGASAAVPLDLVFGFGDLHPQLQVRLREVPDEYPVADLFQDEADVGLVLGHEGMRNCQYTLLVPGTTVLVVARDHPLARKSSVTLADLEGVPLVVKAVEDGTEHPLIERCLAAGITPLTRHETGNLFSLHRLCVLKGVAAVSVDFIEAVLPDPLVTVVPLAEPLAENLWLVTRKRDIQNKAVTLFQSYLLGKMGTKGTSK